MRLVLLSISACLLCGCGIFEVKHPEQPLPDGVAGDPLNIVDIIRSAFPEALPDIDYVGYFTEDVVFWYDSRHPVYGSEVIRMLDNLRSRSLHTRRVTWCFDRRAAGCVDRPEVRSWRDGNFHYLVVSYAVHTSVDASLTHGGAADFILIGSDYKISYWKDMPDGEAFFNPMQ